MAVPLSVTKVWPLEKYARFLSDSKQAELIPQKETSRKGGTWQHYSAKEGSIQMALLESNHFMISSGKEIYESFSLWDTRKWMKGINKGDSILFIYRLNDVIRRFRVKFAPMAPNYTALESCRNFMTTLAPLVPIREMTTAPSGMEDSQMTYDDSQSLTQTQPEATCGYQPSGDSVAVPTLTTSCEQQLQQCSEDENPQENDVMSVPDIAKSLKSQANGLGRAYAETNFPTEQLGPFIRLCLTDANFPGFVEAIEKELNTITGEKR